MKTLLDLQKLFAQELMSHGEQHNVLVVSITNNVATVTFNNNMQGDVVMQGFELEVGKIYPATIEGFVYGMPSFKINDEALFLLKPQIGTIKMIGLNAIAGYFENDEPWIYKGKQQKWMQNDLEVELRRISKHEDYFEVRELSKAPIAPIPEAIKPLPLDREAKNDSLLAQGLKDGSATMHSSVKLGQTYVTKNVNAATGVAKIGKKEVNVYPFIPTDAEEVEVFIYYIDKETKEAKASLCWAKKDPKVVLASGRKNESIYSDFFEPNKDYEVFNKAKENNEPITAGRAYWVGYNYRLSVFDGCAKFAKGYDKAGNISLDEVEAIFDEELSTDIDFVKAMLVKIEEVSAEECKYRLHFKIN